MSVSRRVIRLIVLAGMFAAVASTAYALTTFPPNGGGWLTAKGIGTNAQADAYYARLDATLGDTTTFAQWKALYGFGGADEITAIYYNAGDLGFGREMHCRQLGADAACYVANHGLGPSAPVPLSLDDALGVRHDPPLPIVAMVYKAALYAAGQANAVSFYIYGGDGSRLNAVALDSEGPKFTPKLCLPCHGGTYNTITSTVTGANFLPFDIASFRYSGRPGYTLAAQQEQFRQLNALVRGTQPTALTTELIDGWYAGQVNVPNQPFDFHFIPAAYNATPADQALYTDVFRPYCRACHLTQAPGRQLESPAAAAWAVAPDMVFSAYSMPHTELTSHNFWNSRAPAALANHFAKQPSPAYGFVHVTRLDDPNPQVACVPGNCSLRGALALTTGPNAIWPIVITFDLSGTITLDPAWGALDITQGVTILGNGVGQTVLQGDGQQRVVYIHDATAVLQDLTIENGGGGGAVSAGTGGGVLVTGAFTSVYLNRVWVHGNTAALNGGGLANLGARVELNASTVSGNTAAGSGGGIYNDDAGAPSAEVVRVNASTVSGNTAAVGGGLYNTGPNATAAVFQSTVTRNAAANGGGGFANAGSGQLTLEDSLVAGSTAGAAEADCRSAASPYQSLGHNLFLAGGGCTLTTPTDVTAAGPLDAVLNSNLAGALTGPPYHALVPGSPALDAIPLGIHCSLPLYDQRDVARPLDAAGTGTPACDIGAREYETATVTTAADVVDPRDGLCSLREAVAAANTGRPSGPEGGECPGSPDFITLGVPGPYDLTVSDPASDPNGIGASGLAIQAAVTIDGQGQVIRRAAGAAPFRLILVAAGGNLNLKDATLQGGLSDGWAGGGLRVDIGGVANIQDSTLRDNATLNGSSGGGVLNSGTLNLVNSTLTGNSASNNGGGLTAWDSSLTTLVNVTVRANTADSDADGGGEGGGLAQAGGLTITLKNSLIAGNTDLSPADPPQPDVANLSGAIVSADYNLIGDERGSAGVTLAAHDQVGAAGLPLAPGLGPLTGSPAFYPPLAGSPAVDRIPPADCAFLDSLGDPWLPAGTALAADQRQTARPQDGDGDGKPACDIGAVELIGAWPVYLPLIER